MGEAGAANWVQTTALLTNMIARAFLLCAPPLQQKQWCSSYFFLNRFIYLFIYLFIYFGCAGPCLLQEVFPGHGATASVCGGFSCCRAWGLGCMGSLVAVPRLQSTGSVVAMDRLSWSTACGIFPNQGSNPCLLNWQVDSLSLSHQGSPAVTFLKYRLDGKISFPLQTFQWLPMVCRIKVKLNKRASKGRVSALSGSP